MEAGKDLVSCVFLRVLVHYIGEVVLVHFLFILSSYRIFQRICREAPQPNPCYIGAISTLLAANFSLISFSLIRRASTMVVD
jgi:hypothetical protein